ncbi:hypothetical protein WCLP8_2580011 [uncultured Gammaproteobacteria bacterium]
MPVRFDCTRSAFDLSLAEDDGVLSQMTWVQGPLGSWWVQGKALVAEGVNIKKRRGCPRLFFINHTITQTIFAAT